jgi:hypothetical protein
MKMAGQVMGLDEAGAVIAPAQARLFGFAE